METTAVKTAERLRESVSRVAIGLFVEGVRRSPALREFVLRRLSAALSGSFKETYRPEDIEYLAHTLWFGETLKPFLIRLLQERPKAAKKFVELAYVWASDMRRRNAIEKSGKVAPVTVAIEPTGRCNLRCPGCYANSGPRATDLPYEVWRDVIAEVRDMGVTLITLTGGEPFLRESEDRFISRIAAEFPTLGFLVYTNATMITEDVARRLGDLGNVFPGISTEGSVSESDSRRGAGYSRNASLARERLARFGVVYGFSATVTRRNAAIVSSDAFIDERIAEGDLFGWFFLLQMIGRRPDPSLLVTPEQRGFLREQIYRWRKLRKPIFIGDFWNDGFLTGGCIAAGRGYFHIYSNGDISPCVFSPVACANLLEVRSGNGPYASLADVVNSHPLFVHFREKQKEITDPRAPCPLFDHPEKFRDACRKADWFANTNMPDGYFDGEISRALDENARRWHDALASMPYAPASAQDEIAAVRKELEAHRRA